MSKLNRFVSQHVDCLHRLGKDRQLGRLVALPSQQPRLPLRQPGGRACYKTMPRLIQQAQIREGKPHHNSPCEGAALSQQNKRQMRLVVYEMRLKVGEQLQLTLRRCFELSQLGGHLVHTCPSTLRLGLTSANSQGCLRSSLAYKNSSARTETAEAQRPEAQHLATTFQRTGRTDCNTSN